MDRISGRRKPSKCQVCRSKGLYPCSTCPKKQNRLRRLQIDKLKEQNETEVTVSDVSSNDV